MNSLALFKISSFSKGKEPSKNEDKFGYNSTSLVVSDGATDKTGLRYEQNAESGAFRTGGEVAADVVEAVPKAECKWKILPDHPGPRATIIGRPPCHVQAPPEDVIPPCHSSPRWAPNHPWRAHEIRAPCLRSEQVVPGRGATCPSVLATSARVVQGSGFNTRRRVLAPSRRHARWAGGIRW
jgi:hypothetical protein